MHDPTEYKSHIAGFILNTILPIQINNLLGDKHTTTISKYHEIK